MLRICSPAILVLAALGCAAEAQVVVRLHDGVRIPGRPTRLVAEVRREYTLSLHDRKKDVEVSFSVGGLHVGRVRTDRRGVATLEATINGHHETYEAAAVYKGRLLGGSGRLFTWQPGRTVIAVDIDDTISKTKYSDLFVSSLDRVSPSIEGSAPTLRKLAARFHIVYISARPAWLTEKSRQWLDANGYPRGPVLHQGGWESCLRQTAAKREILQALRRDASNVLVGIGDRSDDAEAFQDNGMLSLLVRDPDLRRIDGATTFARWSDLDRFLDDHGRTLAQAEELATALAQNRLSDLLLKARSGVATEVTAAESDAPMVASGRTPPTGDVQDALD